MVMRESPAVGLRLANMRAVRAFQFHAAFVVANLRDAFAFCVAQSRRGGIGQRRQFVHFRFDCFGVVAALLNQRRDDAFHPWLREVP